MADTKSVILNDVRFERWHYVGESKLHRFHLLQVRTVYEGHIGKCDRDVVIFNQVMSADTVTAASKVQRASLKFHEQLGLFRQTGSSLKVY